MRGAGAATALLLAALLPLAGCATAPSSPAGPDEPDPTAAPLATAVDELRVVAEVYRTRSDPGRGGIQLSLRNDGAAPLVLHSARLDSPALAAAATREDEATVPAGLQRDLPMLLPAPVCEGAGAPAPPAAVLEVLLADGTSAELRMPTADRIGQWARWHAGACLAASAAALAELRVESAPAAEGEIGVRLVAAPGAGGAEGASGAEGAGGAAGGGSVRLLEVSGSVLLSALDADGRPAASIPVPSSLSTAPTELALRYAPARCDAHAIADDKQGTHLRVRLAITTEEGAREGEVVVVPEPAVRDALLAAVVAACASRSPGDGG